MSIFKTIGKVFKKVVSSKIFKIAAAAAAVYFTGGIAAAAMGSEFAAGLPFIADAAGALGVDISAGLGAAANTASAAAGGFGAVDASMAVGGAEGGLGSPIYGASGAADLAGATGAVAPTQTAMTGATGASGGSSIGQDALKTVGKTFGQNAITNATSGNTGSPTDKNWFSEMSKGSQGVMLMNGITGLATAGLNAYGMKTQQDAEQARYDQSRQDAIRRSGVADTSSAYRPAYHTPTAIANSYTPGG